LARSLLIQNRQHPLGVGCLAQILLLEGCIGIALVNQQKH